MRKVCLQAPVHIVNSIKLLITSFKSHFGENYYTKLKCWGINLRRCATHVDLKTIEKYLL